jgi:hypothetical protein
MTFSASSHATVRKVFNCILGIIGMFCLLLLPFCLFLVWVMFQGDTSPEERVALAILPGLLSLWLLIIAIVSFSTLLRCAIIPAIVLNLVALVIGLFCVWHVVWYNINIEDVVLSIVLLSVPVCFVVNQFFRWRKRHNNGRGKIEGHNP